MRSVVTKTQNYPVANEIVLPQFRSEYTTSMHVVVEVNADNPVGDTGTINFVVLRTATLQWCDRLISCGFPLVLQTSGNLTWPCLLICMSMYLPLSQALQGPEDIGHKEDFTNRVSDAMYLRVEDLGFLLSCRSKSFFCSIFVFDVVDETRRNRLTCIHHHWGPSFDHTLQS
ncbi:hypothetical protein P691DRAFT_300838 [Macrolepiota fuliginosa MF-IS2]|uniref:Uncharacterized protein n=1 Tax=Macrolepiota fuliginosa MF-IS2 TaxID=1400762 RepID=A0A9P6C825_9AGAR|nr:hypothetical protein P691DRAFT_300838 [Macrolepiota fuliginosa MF-IS2]